MCEREKRGRQREGGTQVGDECGLIEWVNASNLSFPWQQQSPLNVCLMKELYWRAEWHFVCEGGSIFVFGSCFFLFSQSPQIRSLLIEQDLTWLHVGLIVCVCMHRLNGIFLKRGVSLFSADQRRFFETVVCFWESNKRDRISVFVCAYVWYGFRCKYKHSQQTERRISKAPIKMGYPGPLLVWHFSRSYLFVL